jgi:glycosyltransferase involved in cell wall biosynthesis
MIALSHPFGNQNVRQALNALNSAGLLDRFHTTLYWDSRWPINYVLPRSVRSELNRRTYPQIELCQVSLSPVREAGRLLSLKLGLNIAPISFSTLEIGRKLDAATARYVDRCRPSAVYAYAGIALETFKAARRQGSICIYELPSGYWHYVRKLLQEEALLRPDYADTLEIYRNTAFLDAMDQELGLADHIIVPSAHVKRTLETAPPSAHDPDIVPYGTTEAGSPIRANRRSSTAKLRVLFVGGLTQIKGIAYLFDAIKMMAGAIDFTVIGGRVRPSPALDAVLSQHRWIPSIPNAQVLEEMAQHDVLVLPSLSEGFGLVIGEALSRGLPVITTTASGGPELIRDGQDGFFVPIRSAEAIAEKLEVLNKDRELLDWMSASALGRAREFIWQHYRSLLVSTLTRFLEQ